MLVLCAILDKQCKGNYRRYGRGFSEVFPMSGPRESHDKVLQLLEQHHKWFSESIPLIASENVPSPAVREAIVSDFANRYAE